MSSLTDALVDWVVGTTAADLPGEAFRLATDALTDGFACAIAGGGEELAPKLRAVLRTEKLGANAGAGAWLIGTALQAAPPDAALYNGALAHALDYDDITHPAYAHPSAVLLPVLLALAPRRVDGPTALTAFVMGLEVFGKLGRALNTAHYERGWHATSTFGSVAAAVAAGKVVGLTREQLRMAIGIAASAAGGLRASFGTMTKPLHAGYAARNGVLAALLAEQGFTAGADVLGHRFGYARVFAGDGGEAVDQGPLASWGEPLEILTPYGLAIKPYPSCGATHPGIEAALLLATENGIAAGDVRSIRAGVCEMALQPLIYRRPTTPLEAKFCLEFCIAAAIARREVNLRTFSAANIAAPDVRGLIERTTLEIDERVRKDSEFATVVTVTTTDGTVHERLVPLAKGKPARWMSREDLRAKFDDCAKWGGLDAAAAANSFATLQALADLPDLGRLVVATVAATRPA